MRKLFRFKYEKCEGTCYAWCDEMLKQFRKMPEDLQKTVVKEMVSAHDALCDNPEYSFGIDKDDLGNFVGFFRTPETTSLVSERSFNTCVFKICELVHKENIPQVAGECTYGQNGTENLGETILNQLQSITPIFPCECINTSGI